MAMRAGALSFGPWLWGVRTDLALFGGSAILALLLVALGRATGLSEQAFPEWGWLAFVLAIDVAHVHSTWFRTYLDGAEVKSHLLRYALVPLACYGAGAWLYSHSPLTFWRVLAYLALFHFVRQQVGWVAVYRARARQGRFDKLIDDAAVYLATLYPVLHWHAHLDGSEFAWFVHGDFVSVAGLDRALPWVRAVWLVALVGFGVRQLWLLLNTRVVHLGKVIVVATTAAIWYVGIVATNNDFDFTVTNVIAHGVPYVGLLWSYARCHRERSPRSLGSQVVAGGVAVFLGGLLLLAFVEEFLWDRLVWHDRAWLFGESEPWLPESALVWIVPALALPQAVHYVLDGMLWRRADTHRLPAQRAALGFRE